MVLFLEMMKRITYTYIAMLLGGASLCYATVDGGVLSQAGSADDFARYSVILERKPFGEPPAPPRRLAPPPRPQDKFTKYLRMCAITDTELGIRVGFVDIKAKPPRSYFLYMGEEEDGIKVVSVDYEREEAILMKDGEQAPLYLNGQSAMSISSTAPAAPAAPAPSAVTPRPTHTPTKAMSYSERFRLRREALAKRIEEEKKKKKTIKTMSQGDRQKFLQEYNMELIRAGGKLGPPLPIPLSKEADAQLVKEGVLPPTE